MKVNVFLTFIGILLALLIGYWVYDVASGKENDALCGACSTICLLATIIPTIGLKYESGRLGINLRILSILFLIIFLISHFCFAVHGVIMPTYLIVNGILLIIYLAILYNMAGLKEI